MFTWKNKSTWIRHSFGPSFSDVPCNAWHFSYSCKFRHHPFHLCMIVKSCCKSFSSWYNFFPIANANLRNWGYPTGLFAHRFGNLEDVTHHSREYMTTYAFQFRELSENLKLFCVQSCANLLLLIYNTVVYDKLTSMFGLTLFIYYKPMHFSCHIRWSNLSYY